jgi:hypothetical protein
MVLLSHLWHARPLGLFTVSESRGGLVIACGGISTAYGPILADKEMQAHGPSLPTRLGTVSIQITDSHGIARLAPLLYTDRSFSKAGFLLPTSRQSSFTAPPDGRSIAVGQVTLHTAGKPNKLFPTLRRGQGDCQAVPIPLSPGIVTTALRRRFCLSDRAPSQAMISSLSGCLTH